jgi:hypothetical protein
VGRWTDRFGPGRIMIVETAAFLLIYMGYGFISVGVAGGRLFGFGTFVGLAVVVNLIDRMTIQFGMVRSVYMRSIAITPEDVTPTLASGMAIDHIVSIVSAMLSGIIWSAFGPQYVFVFAGILAFANMMVATRIRKDEVAIAIAQ